MKRTPLILALAGVLMLGPVFPTMTMAQTYNGQTLQGQVTYVPTGTIVDATLTSPIDSAVAKPGDIFNAKLYAPMYLGSDLVLPANTDLQGQVISADKSGLAGKSGAMSLRLTAAVTPDGVRYPLSAIITADQADKKVIEDEGQLKGRTTKKTVTSGVARTAAWTAGGTLLGVIFAPIVAGSVGAGAIAGVATGGAVGLGSNLWRKGKDVKIPSGTRVKFALDQPMALTNSVASSPSYLK
ncbi:MAG TPA: hypothetical protein PKC98_12690 [Candidatus Melainabacteria bacterium]|nr:hypothetical protein [Candidatus Melainabacteria bacterium]